MLAIAASAAVFCDDDEADDDLDASRLLLVCLEVVLLFSVAEAAEDDGASALEEDDETAGAPFALGFWEPVFFFAPRPLAAEADVDAADAGCGALMPFFCPFSFFLSPSLLLLSPSPFSEFELLGDVFPSSLSKLNPKEVFPRLIRAELSELFSPLLELLLPVSSRLLLMLLVLFPEPAEEDISFLSSPAAPPSMAFIRPFI